MSSIILRLGVVLAGALLLLPVGCSKERTPRSLINPETGKHAEQWETPDSHGTTAKAALTSTTGFAACQECHGDDFAGGISNTTCMNTAGCHGAGISAPHSPKPWRGGARTHSNTDQSNAPVCAACHANGTNSSVQPSAFDPGAAPGCFNNTLCHAVAGHSALWENAFYHGAAAKSAPGATTGFSYCQICHGNNFEGGVALQTCLNAAGCHGANVNAPHSPKPWRGDTRTHTDTDPNNAPVCALCHTNGANSAAQPSSFDPAAAPGCFNNTLCHASAGHPDGWEDPSSHGATAKAAPTSTAGFSLCQTCHGNDFIGGSVQKTCLSTAGCHGAGVNAPHSPKPWRDGVRTHTDTDPNNASVCATCHTNGANSSVKPFPYDPVASAGCFNNTLCHAKPVHPSGWQDPDSHGAAAKAAPGATSGFSLCQNCHGTHFAGGTASKTCLNTAGCHGAIVNAPHSPKPWRGATRTHATTNPNNASVCANCHTNGANSSFQPSPYDPIATSGCFNNTLCHANVGAPHAVPFTDSTLHGPLAKSDLTYCQACHANPSNSGAGSNPRFNVTIGSLANGCENCHATNMAHPFLWRWNSTTSTGHPTAGNMANACVLCHGVTLGGDITINSPACTSCHTAGSPLTQTNCTSCHGKPPTGATAPNREGAHAEHNALPNIANSCNTCHNGAGTNTVNHDYGGGAVNVAFLGTTYNAKSGSAAYNAGSITCTNISCHGGSRTQTSTQAGQNPPQSTVTLTPSWLTDSINVSTDCTACHVLGASAGNPENNSYYSGEHEYHIYNKSRLCTDCHDTTKLAPQHFTTLNTPAMEGPASATLRTQLQYNGTSCNPQAGGISSGCHGSKDW